MKSLTIIFDLMDTIVVDPFYAFFPKYFNMPLEELYKIKNPNIWPKFEVCEVTEQEYFNQFFLPTSNCKLEDPENLKQAIFEAYSYVEGMEEFLGELHKRGFSLWIHSNYSFWFEEVRSRLALDRFFQGYAVSYQLGLRKPNHAAYLATLNLINKPASECVFIDDREANIIAAREVGLTAFQFSSTEQLRKELANYLD